MSLSRQTDDESPDLVDVILDAIRSNQLELNSVMPGTIVSYDAANQTAVVQPSFKITYFEPGGTESRAEIDDVRVIFPRSGQQGLVFPVSAGDSVLLLFSQRSLDDWLDEGGEVELSDTRLHNINDAIALVGFASIAERLDPAPANDRVELRGEKVFIGDLDQAEQSLPPQQGVDLLNLMDKTLTAILALTVNAAGVPTTTPINSADFLAIQQDLQKILS